MQFLFDSKFKFYNVDSEKKEKSFVIIIPPLKIKLLISQVKGLIEYSDIIDEKNKGPVIFENTKFNACKTPILFKT